MTKRIGRITGVALCCFAAPYFASNEPGLGQAWGATPDASGYNQEYSAQATADSAITAQVAQASSSIPDASGYNHDYSDATLAKVIPGQTTKAQIEKLLGQPWRTTNYAEAGEDEPGHEPPEVWEWRGRDSKDSLYRVHIEFNQQGTVTNIAKVPEKAATAPARVAPDEAAKAQPPGQAKGPNATPQIIDDPSAGMFRRQMPAQPAVNGGD